MIDSLIALSKSITNVTEYANRVPEHLRTLKPDAIAFSVKEIIYHLLEVEELWHRRIRQLLDGNDNRFQQIDPDALAKEHQYNSKSYEDGIQQWETARGETIKIIDAMTDDEKNLVGVHSRYGEMNVHRIIEIMTNHDLQHLEQMKRTLANVQTAA